MQLHALRGWRPLNGRPGRVWLGAWLAYGL